MAMRYDFDMVAVTPQGLPDQFGDLTATGVGAEKLAMFRDPQVVAALNKADEVVRTFLIDSGFALQVHDSGAPPGRFLQRDEAARIILIDRLSANLATHDVTGANWGDFDFEAFLTILDEAEVLKDETLLAPPPKAPQPMATPSRAPAQSRRGLAMAGLTVGFILILYAALELIR